MIYSGLVEKSTRKRIAEVKEKMKNKLIKKVLTAAAAALLVFVLAAGAAVTALWRNEISSVASIEMLVDANAENKSAPVYIMDVKGDYYFDKFIEEGGVSNDGELIQFVVDNIT